MFRRKSEFFLVFMIYTCIYIYVCVCVCVFFAYNMSLFWCSGPMMKLYVWDKDATDFCEKFKALGKPPTVILVTTVNPKRFGG